MTKKQEKYLRKNMDKIACDTAKDFFQELEDRRSLIFNNTGGKSRLLVSEMKALV